MLREGHASKYWHKPLAKSQEENEDLNPKATKNWMLPTEVRKRARASGDIKTLSQHLDFSLLRPWTENPAMSCLDLQNCDLINWCCLQVCGDLLHSIISITLYWLKESYGQPRFNVSVGHISWEYQRCFIWGHLWIQVVTNLINFLRPRSYLTPTDPCVWIPSL